jgi:hypothetical protein
MSADPSRMDDEALMRHALEWLDLPALPGITRTMTDADVAAHSDVLYVGALVEDLAAARTELHKECKDFHTKNGTYPSEPLMWLQYLVHSAELLPHTTFTMTPSWDEALKPLVDVGERIALWRLELDGQQVAA